VTSLASPGRTCTRMVRVWDPIVRIFHWTLVITFAAAWLTAHSQEGLHQAAGYVCATLVMIRLIWGLIGSPYARFSSFVRPGPDVIRYLVDVARGREKRFIGHNPAGGAMIVLLLVTATLTAFFGWLMTTDTYFGVEWVEVIHKMAADVLLVLALLHVGGVLLASFRHRENLIAAMVHGRKRAPEPGEE
jgi:cytochrome b